MGCVIVERDSLALFTALKILQGTLYPLYVTAHKVYKICHFVGLKKSQCYSLRSIRKAPTKKRNRRPKPKKLLKILLFAILDFSTYIF